ncbi:YndJ family transporter [Streptomyces sp. NPDC005151]
MAALRRTRRRLPLAATRRPRDSSRRLLRTRAALLALHAPPRLLRTVRATAAHRAAPAEIALLTALVTPSVAALALVAERSGHTLFGFGPGILALTVPHFHFAGFAAALVSGLVCRVTDSPGGRFAALSVPLGTLLVLAGYFIGDWAELAGAVVLAFSRPARWYSRVAGPLVPVFQRWYARRLGTTLGRIVSEG